MSDEEFDAEWKAIAADLRAEGVFASEPQSLDTPGQTFVTPETSGGEKATEDSRSLPGKHSFTGSDVDPHDVAPILSPRLGPRDWTPSEPGNDSFDLDPDTLDPEFTAPIAPQDPAHIGLLWLLPLALVVLAVLIGLGILPGGNWMVAVCSIGALGAAAITLFAYSPHKDDTDPYDDGARI